LTRRGYSLDSVEAIMGGNWLRLLRRHLPCDRP
jgi:microsomal dipeptidase-like Zn-dependent dipeptidase